MFWLSFFYYKVLGVVFNIIKLNFKYNVIVGRKFFLYFLYFVLCILKLRNNCLFLLINYYKKKENFKYFIGRLEVFWGKVVLRDKDGKKYLVFEI